MGAACRWLEGEAGCCWKSSREGEVERRALRAEVIGLVEGPRMERTGEMQGKEVGRRRG